MSRPAALAWCVAMAALLGALAAEARQEDRKRVVVERFTGPQAGRVRAAVVGDLEGNVDLIDEDEFSRAVDEATGVTRPDRIMAACATVGVDAVIEGEIRRARRAWEVEIVVRDCESGQKMLPGGRAIYPMRNLAGLGAIRSSLWRQIGRAVLASAGPTPRARSGRPRVAPSRPAPPSRAAAPCLFEEDEPPEGFPGYGDWVRRRNAFLIRCQRDREQAQQRQARAAEEERRRDQQEQIAERRRLEEEAHAERRRLEEEAHAERRRLEEQEARRAEQRQRQREHQRQRDETRRERIAAARARRAEEQQRHEDEERASRRAAHEARVVESIPEEHEQYEEQEERDDEEDDQEDDEQQDDDDDDDDDDGDAGTVAIVDEPPVANLNAGIAYLNRSMTVETTGTTRPRTYSVPAYAEATLSFELFPLALASSSRALVELGLFGLYRHDIGLQTTGLSESLEPVDVSTQSDELLLGVMSRTTLGRSSASPTLTFQLGYGTFAFELEPSQVSLLEPERQLPSMIYRNFVFASRLSVPLLRSGVAIDVGGQYRSVIDVGQPALDLLGDTTGGGLGLGAHLGVGGEARFIADGLIWALESDYVVFTTDFSGTPRNGTAAQQFGTGTDRYIRILFLAGYRIR